MRLSVYGYNYAPEPTGIAVFTTGMCRWFARSGWQVGVATGIPWYPGWRPDPSWDGRLQAVDAGVEVRRVAQFIPARPTALGRIRLDWSWLWRTACATCTERRRPDVLMVVAPPFLGGFLGLWLRWRWRVPFVYHVQDLQVDAAADLGLLPRGLTRLLLLVEARLLAHADLVTTISPAMRRRLLAKSPDIRRVGLLPNWVELQQAAMPPGPNPFRTAWGLGSDDLVIAYSGSVGRKQGLDHLLEAFSLLADDPRLHLVIAAGGSGVDELRARAAALGLPRFRLLDLVPAADLGAFLAAADVHCVVQRRAAADLVLPSKLMNLLAAGRPVVVTADGATDLARLVRRSGAGEVVPPEDPVALAAGIRGLLADQPRRIAAGSAGRDFAARCLSADAILGPFSRRLARLADRLRRHAA